MNSRLTLGVTKQTLHGPKTVVRSQGYVVAERDVIEHRVKILILTPKGARIEQVALRRNRSAIEAALAAVPKVQEQCSDVMLALSRIVGR